MGYQHIQKPSIGDIISLTNGVLGVSSKPIVLFIEGDGIGPDITKAMRRVVDAAVAKAFKNQNQIQWMEIYAGEKAKNLYGEYLPQESIDAINEFKLAIKGPLTTPIGGGIRSLNVALRQILDLYQCIRPVCDYGAPSPVKHPERMNIVVFRENTEDVYAGIEYKSGTPEAGKLEKFLREELGARSEERRVGKECRSRWSPYH